MFRVVSSISVILFLTLAGCGGDEASEAEFMDQAKILLSQKDAPASSIQLKNVLQINPNNMEARLLLGINYVEFGDGLSAEKELRLAQDLGAADQVIAIPLAKAYLLQRQWESLLQGSQVVSTMPASMRAELHSLRGRALLESRNVTGAATEYEQALIAEKDSAPAMIGQAVFALAHRKMDDARSWIEKALAQSPESGDAWSMAGDIERVAGNKEKAEEAYSKAVELRMNNGQNRLDRALLRIDLGRYEEADADLVELKKRSPRHPGVAFAQGMIHFRNQRFSEAQIAYDNALNFNAKTPQLKFYLGATHLVLGNLQQAEDNLRQFSNRFPRSAEASRLLARARAIGNDLEGAEAALKPLLAREAEDIAAITLLGNVYLAQGDVTQGLVQLERAVELQPKVADSRYSLGIGLLDSGSFDRGIEEIRQALNIEPGMQRAELALVSGHLEIGDFDAALQAIGKLKEEGATDPTTHRLRGLALLGKGDKKGAREAFGKALDADPEFNPARLNLALLEISEGNMADAEHQFREVLKSAPESLEAARGLARLAGNAGRLDEELSWREKAWAGNPDSIVAGQELVQAYLQRDEITKALGVVRGMENAHPGHPDTLRASGVARLTANDRAAAISDFSKLSQLQPDSVEAWHLLAAAQHSNGERLASSKSLSKALELDNGYLPSLLAKVRFNQEMGRFDEALAATKPILEHYPEKSIGHKLEGELRLGLEDYPGAIAAFQSALTNSRDPDVLITLARAQRLSGDEDAAQSTLAQWREQINVIVEQADQESDQALRAQFVLVRSYLEEYQHGKALELVSKLSEQNPQSAAVHHLKGSVLVISGDVPNARKSFDEALRMTPGYPPAIHALAWQALSENNVDRAEALYMQALRTNPGHFRTQMALMQLESDRGRIDQAREWALRILEVHPDAAVARLLLARHYLSTAQPRKTLALLSDIKTQGPDAPAMLQLRGEAYLALKQSEEALTAFNKILLIDPASAEVQVLLAKAHIMTGDREKAGRSLAEAIRINPQHLVARIFSVQLLTKSGRLEEAATTLERLAQDQPDNAEISAQRGELALKRDRLPEAEEAFTQALEQFAIPNAQVAAKLVAVKWKIRNKQQAFDFLDEWLANHPNDNFMLMTAANYFLLDSRKEFAKKAYEKVLESAPDTLIALHNMAGLLQDSDIGRAQQMAERAAVLSPESPAVLDRLGLILLSRQSAERAVATLRRALDVAPERAAIRFHLAQALSASGERDAALRLLDAMLSDKTEFDEREEALALQKTLRSK